MLTSNVFEVVVQKTCDPSNLVARHFQPLLRMLRPLPSLQLIRPFPLSKCFLVQHSELPIEV